MPRVGAHFPQRLVTLGLPDKVAGGFAADGPFWALFDGSPAALCHYLTGGEAAGQRPSPYFDPAYYKAQNPDWRAAGTALGHYLQGSLAGEERAAHPLFDALAYGQANPDLAQAGAATLLHFAQYGDAEGRAPGPAFDADWYRRVYLPLEATRAFAHFTREGRAAGLLPCPPQRGTGALTAHLRQLCDDQPRPILIALHDARQAGAPKLTLALTRGLRARGWNPVVLLEAAGPLLPDFQTCAPVVILSEGWDRAELARSVPGVPVIAQTVHMAWLAACMAPGRPALLMVHEMPDYWRAQDLESALTEAAAQGAHVLLSFPSMAGAFARLAPAASHGVLRPGLIPATLTCGQRLTRARALRGAGPVVIGAGYADRRKGFDWFVETAVKISDRAPSARFVWLGELGSWAQGLADEVRATGLSLTLPGFVDDAHAWYAAADLFLLCSRSDPGPYVVADAASQGVPFVGFDTDLGLRDEALRHGHLVPEGDTDCAAQTALRVIAQDSPQARRARRRALPGEGGFEPYLDGILSALS